MPPAVPVQLPPAAQPLPGQPAIFDPTNPAGTSPRFLFAGAVAMIAKSVGVSLVSSLSQGIVNWFNAPGRLGGAQTAVTPWMPPVPMGAGAGAYPGMMADQQAMAYPTPMPGAYGAQPGALPPPMMPAPNPAIPGAPMPAVPTPAVPMPGTPMTPAPMMTAPTMPPPMTAAPMSPTSMPALYAGIAFEVHLLEAGGIETAVDPGSYVFRSGQRFLVYYRPSLPGRVQVSNVSPAGEVIPIETLTLAAGELAKLGPYQLTDPAGDEALRLVLEPCSSPELVAATRNIVKATDTGTGSDLHLGSCQTSTSPSAGVATRNIVKATMDGSTGFALDPVNGQELASGRLRPRETTIAIHHR
ncbi:MAG TPA: hypothetical protein VEU78_04125 [Steroidobacteraceae bacterium]|nr:hypothetical protein [Steroidobacteraceae bacterium]